MGDGADKVVERLHPMNMARTHERELIQVSIGDI